MIRLILQNVRVENSTLPEKSRSWSSGVKIEAGYFAMTLISGQKTTRRNNSEGHNRNSPPLKPQNKHQCL